MARRYRRRSSPLSDVASSSRRGPWWRPLAFGGFGFILFGVAYPLSVMNMLADVEAGMLRPVLDEVLGRRVRGAILLGMACLLLGAGLSCWKLWAQQGLDAAHLRGASFLSRLLARLMN